MPRWKAVGVGQCFSVLIVLDAVSLALRADEVVGVGCPNGAGETTLPNILAESLSQDLLCEISAQPVEMRR
jgi:ABC-type branched-subunit amino acid transport system ATPase component